MHFFMCLEKDNQISSWARQRRFKYLIFPYNLYSIVVSDNNRNNVLKQYSNVFKKANITPFLLPTSPTKDNPPSEA